MNAPIFIDILKAVTPFCENPPRENHPALAGVQFEFMPGGVNIAAMSGISGIVVKASILHGNSTGDTVTLDQLTIKPLINYLQEYPGEITLAAAGDELHVMCGPEVKTFQGIHHKHPNWKRAFNIEGAKPVAEVVLFNPMYLTDICKAFKHLGKKRIDIRAKLTLGGALNRSIFTLPIEYLKPDITEAHAVLMPCRS